MQNLSSKVPSDRLQQLALLCLFLALRSAALWYFQDDLNADPDGYLRLGIRIAAGHGLSDEVHDGTTDGPPEYHPTAYRPPLYPILLAPISEPDQQLGRGLQNLLFSVITYISIWKIGLNLGLTSFQILIANAIQALDPLSIRYAAYPMTETLCTALVAVLMVCLTSHRQGRLISFLTGLAFGLCVLSRPTFWACGGIYALFWILSARWRATPDAVVSNHFETGTGRPTAARRLFTPQLLCLVAGVTLVVLPWVVRNYRCFGVPIFMTTHGGYTLLLGNNPEFYREVVDQPWGTIWDGSHGPGQKIWYENLLQQAGEAGIRTEVELDRWMSQQAWRTILAEPLTFLRASLLKWTWFWNLGPIGPEAGALPAIVLWGVRTFYFLFWIAALIGLVKTLREILRHFRLQWRWLALILFIFSLSAVHLMYWSDTRMRAPITPELALLAAVAWPGRRESISHG